MPRAKTAKDAKPKVPPPTHPCTCACQCPALLYQRGAKCSACRNGCFACGCYRRGGRCAQEGVLYAALESALTRLQALGYETHPDCLPSAPPRLADALTQARREYTAHFGGQGRL